MKRYLAMLGMVTLLALPAIATAETNDYPMPVQRTADAGQLARLLARKGVITEQELAQVSTPATAGSTKEDREGDQVNPYLRDGRLW